MESKRLDSAAQAAGSASVTLMLTANHSLLAPTPKTFAGCHAQNRRESVGHAGTER